MVCSVLGCFVVESGFCFVSKAHNFGVFVCSCLCCMVCCVKSNKFIILFMFSLLVALVFLVVG